MPIMISYRSKFKCKSKDGIQFIKPLKRNMLTIKNGSYFKIEKGGKLIFTGEKAFFNTRSKVLISSNAVLGIGNNIWVNSNSEFYCRKKLNIGDDVLIAFHVIIMDTDYHPIFNEQNAIVNHDRSTIIGNKVWIGCNVTILKGTHVGNNIVIGACSLVNGNLLIDNSVYFGNPASFVKNGITWNRDNSCMIPQIQSSL